MNWSKNELHTEDPQRAYRAMRATMHALRDRLVPDEAADLAAQLPMLIRGLYYEAWVPSAAPRKDRNRQEFLDRVAERLDSDPELDPVRASKAIFAILQRRVSNGEMADVRHSLPETIRSLWPET